MSPIDKILSHGFPSDRARLIHGLVGGSALHGIKLEGTDDLDLYGVFIESPLDCFWEGMDHFVTSTSPQELRNGPGDVDVTCYSLRRFSRLALAGNPTIIHMLFSPAEDGELEWGRVLGARAAFLAKSHARKYVGYADAQLQRMTGVRGLGKHGQRPELESKFGFDTKAGMHVLRLLHEGIQLMEEGWVTLPRPESPELLAVRRGERSREWVIQESQRLFEKLRDAAARSPLPDHPDTPAVSKVVVEVYFESWRGRGFLNGGLPRIPT